MHMYNFWRDARVMALGVTGSVPCSRAPCSAQEMKWHLSHYQYILCTVVRAGLEPPCPKPTPCRLSYYHSSYQSTFCAVVHAGLEPATGLIPKERKKLNEWNRCTDNFGFLQCGSYFYSFGHHSYQPSSLLRSRNMVTSLRKSKVLRNISTHWYADDTVLYSYGSSLPDALHKLQSASNILQSQLTQLKVNADKMLMFLMLGGSIETFWLLLQLRVRHVVSCCTYLSIWLDECLSFKEHAENLVRKLRLKFIFYFSPVSLLKFEEKAGCRHLFTGSW